jgi:hypothetical protein
MAIAAGFALSGCGGSSDASDSASATSSSASSEPECSKEALDAAAANATGGTFGGTQEFTCDGGWAVAQGDLNDLYLPLLFKAQDGAWSPVEILNACQAGEVPATIADIACA